MDTKNEPSSKIPALRTYASDLELGRKTRDFSPKDEKIVEAKVIPTKEEELLKEVVKELPLITSIPPTENISIKETTPTIANKVTKINKVTKTKSTPTIPRRDTFIAENTDSAPATIITDAKHGRFKLMPAIKASIKSWFTSKKVSYQAKKIPKYTVPDTSGRKEVIQKATSKTGKLATSDFSSIHERIRNRNENERKANPPTTWSANTEPGFLLLEEPDSSSITNVQMISRRSFRTVPQEIRVTEINHNRKSEVLSAREYTRIATAENTTPVTGPVTVAAVAKEIIPVAGIGEKLSLLEENDALRWHPETGTDKVPPKIFEAKSPTTEPAPSTSAINSIHATPEAGVQIPLPQTPSVNESRWISERPAKIVPVEVSKQVPSPVTNLEQTKPTDKEEMATKHSGNKNEPTNKKIKKNFLSLNTNILTLCVSGLAIAIVLFVGLGYFWVNEQIERNSSLEATALPLIIDVPLKQVSATSDNKEDLLEALTNAGKESNEAIQIVLLSSKPNHEPIPPKDLLSTFDVFLEQNFTQSISNLRFGLAKDRQPFVIIRTTHETAAKGGLLMWENGMYEDLAEILLIEETDPIASTKFIDASLNGIDVRVLKNNKGAERLIYGFTKDTIIITTNIFNFSELAKSVK